MPAHRTDLEQRLRNKEGTDKVNVNDQGPEQNSGKQSHQQDPRPLLHQVLAAPWLSSRCLYRRPGVEASFAASCAIWKNQSAAVLMVTAIGNILLMPAHSSAHGATMASMSASNSFRRRLRSFTRR